MNKNLQMRVFIIETKQDLILDGLKEIKEGQKAIWDKMRK